MFNKPVIKFYKKRWSGFGIMFCFDHGFNLGMEFHKWTFYMRITRKK